jgi:hypothetical protein
MADEKPKKNTGKAYERLTQQVFQAILDHEGGVDTVTVEHDVTVQGSMTTHQIDVLWRFRNAGVEHTVVVQCKDHADAVSQGELLLFKQVLDDIPGQPRGVFVTRTGYQSGAVDVARAAGIVPYILRAPREEDWKGRIRNISTDVRLYAPEFRNHHVEVDEEWFAAELERLGLPKTTQVTAGPSHGETVLEDEAGNALMTVNELCNSLVPAGFVEQDWTRTRHAFPNPAFLPIDGDSNFRRLKLVAWTVDIKVDKSHLTTATVRGDEIVGFILQNVLDGTRTTLGKGVQLLRRDSHARQRRS